MSFDQYKVLQKHVSEIKQTLQTFRKKSIKMDIIQMSQNLMDHLLQSTMEFNIYILISGTINSGKSTFINSLLGYELLPYSNSECTKKHIFIRCGNELQINKNYFQIGTPYPYNFLTFLFKDEMDRIDVETPSIFHNGLPENLKQKVILIDTYSIYIKLRPGVTAHRDDLEKLFPKFDFKPQDLIIQCHLIDYPAYAEQRRGNSNFIQEVQNASVKQVNDLFFIINKIDLRNQQRDLSIETIKKEIRNNESNDNIFGISSSNALKYRIWNSNNVNVKNQYVEIYQNNDLRMRNLEQQQCFEQYQWEFGDERLIDDKENQEYKKFLDDLQKKIQNKIEENLDNCIFICKSFYYFLQIILKPKFYITGSLKKAISKRLNKMKIEIRDSTKRIKSNLKDLFLETAINNQQISNFLQKMDKHQKQVEDKNKVCLKDIQIQWIQRSDNESNIIICDTCKSLSQMFEIGSQIWIKTQAKIKTIFYEEIGYEIQIIPKIPLSVIPNTLLSTGLTAAGYLISQHTISISLLSMKTAVLVGWMGTGTGAMVLVGVTAYLVYHTQKKRKIEKAQKSEQGKLDKLEKGMFRIIEENCEQQLLVIEFIESVFISKNTQSGQ